MVEVARPNPINMTRNARTLFIFYLPLLLNLQFVQRECARQVFATLAQGRDKTSRQEKLVFFRCLWGWI
jgi:hypothetical protein